TPDVAFSSSEPGSTFECRLEGSAWQPCASPDTLASLADGEHTLDVRATDPAGNVDATPASWTWLVDTTPPTATMGDPGRVVRGTVSLSSTTADPGDSASGVASVAYEYSADGGTTWAPAPADWDTTSVEDDVYELRVVATDHAGNVTASSPVTDVRVDNTAPTTSLDDPAANVRGTVTLTGAAADAGSGVAQVQFQVSPAGASTWLPLGIASAAPYSVELDTTTLPDGLYDFRTVALDVAGNEGDGAPVTGIRVDNTPPTVSLGNPGANLRRTVDLAGNADDGAGSGVASLVYEYSPAGAGDWHPAASTWNTSSVADGVYDLRAVATDAAGNVGASPVVTSRVDNTPPATTDNAPSGWQSSAVTVTLSASDAGSGPSATEYSVDGGPFQSGTSVDVQAPSDGSNDGSHTIAYFSTDVAGNVEAVHSTDVLIDASPPGSHPTDPGAYLRGTVTLHASPSAPSGIASVAFQYSQAGEDDWTTVATDTAAPYSAVWDTTAVDDGEYDLRFVVTDRSTPANVTRTTLPSKIVDNTAPGGVVGSPAAGETVTGDVTVSAAAHDATSRVASVELRVNGSTVATDTSAPYRATWDSTSVGDGSASADAVITDLAGNTYTTPSVAFTVDNHAPTPTLSDPGSPARGTITLASESDPDTTDVEFQRSPAGVNDWSTIAADASAPFGVSFATTGVPDGRYDLRALATDGSGHRGASPTRTVLVDNTAPTATLTAPADGASVGGPSVDLQASADDGAGSGVASVAFEERPTSGGAWTAIATDGSAPYTATWDTTSLASGGYEVRAVATDGAGNTANGHAVTVTVDSSAPTVTLADPGSPLHGAVTLTAIAGASARSVAFEVSRAGAASWRTIGTDTSTPWSTSFDTRTVRDGVYDLRAVASDAFGNTRASVRAGIRIDNTAPSLASSTPSEGATVASASSIELVASEALASVTGVTLNGAGTVPPVVGGSHVTFATGALADGAYTLAGVLHDLAGKRGSFELHFTVSSGTPGDPPPVSENTSSDDSTTVDASDGSASVTMPANAWADPGNGDWVVVTIDPRPATETLLPGYLNDGEVESITARWALSGTEVHRFDAPLEIVLRSARPDDIPATSEGHGWRVLAPLAGTTLPAGADDGFYRVGDTVHVLTRHLSLWALVRDTQAPASPTGFHGTVAGGRLTLYWTPSPDGGAAGDQVVLYVDGKEAGRYPTSQTQADLGPFGFDDTGAFALAQVDAVGNVGERTIELRGLPELAGKTQADAATALAGRGFHVGAV
ncbi:MAG: hypothetical protein E6G22_05250, partial [Actinobacteria bacterium]